MSNLNKIASNAAVVFLKQHALPLILFVLTIGALIWTWTALQNLVEVLHQLI